MGNSFEEWPESWGIPFAIWLDKGEFQSKVRLNKILSLLQRDGFPIKNKFVNSQMGPYDVKIDSEVEQLDDGGIITYEEKPTEHESDLSIYKLTEEGEKFVENKILPKINELPYDEGFITSLSQTITLVKFTKIPNLIDKVHEDLYLDDIKKFLSETYKVHKELNNIFNIREKNFVDYCSSYLYQIGLLEFTVKSLKRIMEGKYLEPTTGKNHVLYNSKKLIELLKAFDINKNPTFIECLKSRACNNKYCPISDNILKHRFHCIEYNSHLYNINQMIDYETYEFNEIFE